MNPWILKSVLLKSDILYFEQIRSVSNKNLYKVFKQSETEIFLIKLAVRLQKCIELHLFLITTVKVDRWSLLHTCNKLLCAAIANDMDSIVADPFALEREGACLFRPVFCATWSRLQWMGVLDAVRRAVN